MLWDGRGDKHYSSPEEAILFLRAATRKTIRWLHECRENRTVLFFQQYRSLLNDIANVTIRWIEEREDYVSTLEKRVGDLEAQAAQGRPHTADVP
jgi:hypothetical protein